MKKKEFSTLGGKLLPCLPGYGVEGALIFAEPVGHILRGISFDSSSHGAKVFYAHVFYQPLCVPAEHVHWTFGFRLTDRRKHDCWNSQRPDLVDALREAAVGTALPYLETVGTLEGAARAAEAISRNSHAQEAAAFCWLLAGDSRRAASLLDGLCRLLSDSVSSHIAWQVEQLRRAEYIRGLLRDDPNLAIKQLLAWEAEAAKRFGLRSEYSSVQP